MDKGCIIAHDAMPGAISNESGTVVRLSRTSLLHTSDQTLRMEVESVAFSFGRGR